MSRQTPSSFVQSDELDRRSRERASAIMRSLFPAQRALITDPAPHVSGLCPRRSGKSYAAAAAALITGEAKPGSITIVISLNLKQLKRIYWAGGPSGLFTMDRKFGLGLEFNKTEHRWEHQNGSIGYLLGADDPEQREVIRGLEADLYIVDECKSFAPNALEDLIDNVIDPQRETRRGRIILIGTPGNVRSGPFWRATSGDSPEGLDEDGRPGNIIPGTTDKWGRTAEDDLLWSFHHWTLRDNTAAPHQWEGALRKKRSKKWGDDNPTWMREYLGAWVAAPEALVYRYSDEKPRGNVTWTPQRTAENPSGLPPEGAPWHLVAGLDLGFNDPTALVVLGYSRVTREVRHVWDTSAAQVGVHDVAQMVKDAQSRFGKIEIIYADMNNYGGKMLAQSLLEEHAVPVVRAEKREKYDHIQLVNDAFHRGEIKVIPDTVLEHQLITDAWALGDDSFEDLARRGRLIEDRAIPNDAADAFLYAYRGAMNRYGDRPAEVQHEVMSREWVTAWEKAQLRAARAEARSTPFDRALNGDRSVPHHLRRAVAKKQWESPWTTPN